MVTDVHALHVVATDPCPPARVGVAHLGGSIRFLLARPTTSPVSRADLCPKELHAVRGDTAAPLLGLEPLDEGAHGLGRST